MPPGSAICPNLPRSNRSANPQRELQREPQRERNTNGGEPQRKRSANAQNRWAKGLVKAKIL
jgi:hypothetical protein